MGGLSSNGASVVLIVVACDLPRRIPLEVNLATGGGERTIGGDGRDSSQGERLIGDVESGEVLPLDARVVLGKVGGQRLTEWGERLGDEQRLGEDPLRDKTQYRARGETRRSFGGFQSRTPCNERISFARKPDHWD